MATSLSEEAQRLKWTLGTYEVPGTKGTFVIYGSLMRTLTEAEKMLQDTGILIRCYHYLTEDDRLTLPLHACRQVVLGEIQMVWYQISGREVPAKVTENQEERMAKAKSTTAEQEQTEGAAPSKSKEPRITNRSIIEAGLLAGKPEDEILAEVKARFPDGKANSSHISYYRHFLVKAGKLEAQPRKTRSKAAEEAQAPEPQAVQATKGSAKAAAPKAAAPAPKATATATKSKKVAAR